MYEVEKHRPGVFKQPNKTHKTGRHRSKGLIHKDTKGRLIDVLYQSGIVRIFCLQHKRCGATRGLSVTLSKHRGIAVTKQ